MNIVYLLYIGWICFTGSIRIIFYLFFLKKTNTRAFINQQLRQGALKIIRAADLKPELLIESGWKLDRNTSYIYMGNHASLLDIPLIYAILPGTIRLIAKPQLFEIPIFGKAIQAAETISSKDKNLFARVKSLMKNGVSIWFFPEGQRSKDGTLLNFKAGGFTLAREVGATIIPVAIHGTRELLPKNSFFLKRGVKVTIRVGRPIDSTHYARIEQQPQLMREVKNAINNLNLQNWSSDLTPTLANDSPLETAQNLGNLSEKH